MDSVVITGIGSITPMGHTWEESWGNLLAGKCGLSLLKRTADDKLPPTVVGEIQDYRPEDHFPHREATRLDRHIQYALVALRDALQNARLDTSEVVPTRGGVITGVGAFGIETVYGLMAAYQKEGVAALRPWHMGNVISSTAAGAICLATGFQGFSMNLQTACASSTTGVGMAKQMIQSGAYDVILVVGAEAPLSPPGLAAWLSMAAMSIATDPSRSCRPFHKDRDGLVMSEGATCLVLESEFHARARGATVWAKVAGYGHSNDAYAPYSPSSAGQVMGVMNAFMDCGIQPDDIGYVNTHGTATIMGDDVELATLISTFGTGSATPLIGATKSMTGHMLGAVGALEVAICAAALSHKCVPPNLNLEKPIGDLNWVPSVATPTPGLRYTLSQNFGFGGNNAIVILEAA